MIQDFFPYRLAVTSATFSRLLVDVYQRRFGLGHDEWRLLYLLASVKAETSLDLGRNSSLDNVQVSRAADRLLRKGLIRRAALERGLPTLDRATKSVAADLQVSRQTRPFPAPPRSTGAEV